MDERTGNELIIGLVGAIGADLGAVSRALQKAFERVDYETREVRLIELVAQVYKGWRYSTTLKLEDRYRHQMDAGNELRTLLKRNDALALLALAGIRHERMVHNSGIADRPIARCAYIIRSLKTPDEAERLRKVYGANCLIVAAYSSKKEREKMLASKIASSHFESNGELFAPQAKELIVRDEKENGNYGQNVRGTFWTADVFLNAGSEAGTLEKDAGRFIDLLFGHPFSTPTRDECGLFQAHGAGLRSASAGRQVGAAIATPDGDILAVGTNEVAKAFGGQYWHDDANDSREHTRAVDLNAEMTRNIITDLLVRLKRKGWLDESHANLDARGLLECANQESVLKALSSAEADEEGLPSLAESARVKHVIEFIRAVHAEMAAITSAARLGIPVNGCTLYSTTFPCHECAKHIVAAGIRRVVFVEPYPKSRVADMYGDSIAIDDESAENHVKFKAFVGVAPRKYVELFSAPERDAEGAWVDFEKVKRSRTPRLGGPLHSYFVQETEFIDLLDQSLQVEIPSLPTVN